MENKLPHFRNVDDLPKDLLVAREKSILGQYQESDECYNDIMKKIQFKMADNANSQEKYFKWDQFQKQISLEKNYVSQMIQICRNLENGTAQDDVGPPDDHNMFQGDLRRPGGERPIEPQSFQDNHQRNERPIKQQRAMPKPRNEPQPDPSQYQPSWPGAKMGGAPPSNAPYNPPNRNPPKSGPDKLKMNPKKPKNSQPVGNGLGDDERDEAGKPVQKNFLQHHYPDGAGPDIHLIEALERDCLDKNPNVSFADIAGLDECKKLLREAVLLPIIAPHFFTGIRRPWKGVLMYGPPGTGKTMLAKAVAAQGKTTFFNVSASSLASKFYGESEKLVKILFEMARFYAPTTIFMDEIDALVGSRGSSNESEGSRRVLAELLVQMDGATSNSSAAANEKQDNGQNGETKAAATNVMVLAATNRPQDLDEALRRRLEKRVYIPLPDELGRESLISINMKGLELEDGVEFKSIVTATKGFSGADMSILCREAAMMPLRRRLNASGINLQEIDQLRKDVDVPVSQRDFTDALKNTSKSVSQKNLDFYAEWQKKFGST